jgi:hypothetical protein
MSDIGLKGVGGLVVIAVAVGLSVFWTLAALVTAQILRSRGREPFRTAFIRWGTGPVLSLVVSCAGLAWSLDGPGEVVDRAGPLVLFGSLGAGVLATLALRRWRPQART